MRRLVRQSILACVLLASRAAWSVPPEREEWLWARTQHFIIIGNANRDHTVEVAIEMERFRAVIEKEQQIDAAAQPITVFLFKDEASFAPYKRSREGQVRNYVGLFAETRSGPTIAICADLERSFETAYHEYTHFVMSQRAVTVPLWLNEGMADYLSTFRSRGDKFEIGRPVRGHVELLRELQMLGLTDLFAMKEDSRDYHEGLQQGIFYAQSWALYHYLRHERTAVHACLGDLVAALNGGADVDAAFRTACGIDSHTLERELEDYIASTEFEYFVIELPDIDKKPSVQVEKLARAYLLYHLGNYLAEVTPWETQMAEAHLQEALALEPGHARAHAVLAGVLDRSGRSAEAQERYEQAIQLGANDDLPWFLYGQARADKYIAEHSGYELAPDSLPTEVLAIRGLLGRAVALNPESGAAYATLGWTYLYEPGDVTAGIEILQRAQALLPKRLDIVYNLVLLCLRQGDRETAEGLTEQVLVHAEDRTLLDGARAALLQHAEYQHVQRYNLAVAAFNAQEYNRAIALLDSLLPSVGNDSLRQDAQRLSDAARRQQLEQRHVDLYNQAVAKARAGDRKGAIAIVEQLLRETDDPDLRRSAQEMLTALQKQAAPSTAAPRK